MGGRRSMVDRGGAEGGWESVTLRHGQQALFLLKTRVGCRKGVVVGTVLPLSGVAGFPTCARGYGTPARGRVLRGWWMAAWARSGRPPPGHRRGLRAAGQPLRALVRCGWLGVVEQFQVLFAEHAGRVGGRLSEGGVGAGEQGFHHGVFVFEHGPGECD